MSLKHIANHLAAQGRGVDSVLVHMSPGEVKNLQGIARAHGGSLTINPNTGLVEAGFLSNILPAVEGAALMAGSAYMGMPMDPSTAAMIVGGVNGIQKGSLSQGISAGMGAYGGAGLEQGAAANGMLESAPSGNVTPPAAPDLAPTPSAPAFDPSQPFANPDYSAYTQNAPAPAADPTQLTGQIDARSSYDPTFQPPTYGGTTESSLKPYSAWDLVKDNPKYTLAAAAPGIMGLMQQNKTPPPDQSAGMVRPYTYNYNSQASNGTVAGKPMIGTKYTPGQDTSERQWFQPTYTAGTPYTPIKGVDYAAGGAIDSGATPAPVEQMSNENAVGQNTGYPMAYNHNNAFATPWQTPESQNVLSGSGDIDVDPYTGEQKFAAGGGISTLGGYSDGGRLLKGPGDGMSDNIPAQIGQKQPARLADGEFVVPADVVSHLGNGSTDAGANQLYKMMDKVRQARTGRKAQGKQINPNKYVPA